MRVVWGLRGVWEGWWPGRAVGGGLDGRRSLLRLRVRLRRRARARGTQPGRESARLNPGLREGRAPPAEEPRISETGHNGPVNGRLDADEPATILVTGIGSMPGTDAAEAARIVGGEFGVPYIAELPARGPGADMIGRTLALLANCVGDFAGETTPEGWRLVGNRSGAALGRQMRRGWSWFAEDLDRLEDELQGFAGVVKTQVTGPWTLAAGVESVRGTRLVADASACHDLSEALTESLGEHVGDLRRRVPGARVVVQIDEPGLPAVMGGRIRPASGRGALRSPDLPEIVSSLAMVRQAAARGGCVDAVVHCCAAGVPFDALRRSGFTSVSLDARLVERRADEALGRWWDGGGTVVLGVAPSLDRPGVTAESLARAVAALWSRIGFGMADVGPHTWLSPSCGLAGASPAWSRAVGGRLTGAARLLESAS